MLAIIKLHDNCVSVCVSILQDEDEATNRRAATAQSRPEGSGVALPTSRWNVDGDELPKADIDVRYEEAPQKKA